jgi:hypothetical protein
MFPLGIVHSVIHTLLLALSTSGRSAYPLEHLHEYSQEYLFAHPKMSIAFALPHLRNTGTQQSSDSLGSICIVSLVEDKTSAVLVANALCKSTWTLGASRRNTFLGAPANNVLARQHQGRSITKIRKIFTVRKNNIAHDDTNLSYSAPPDDYDSPPDLM